MPGISIVIPVLDDAPALESLLQQLHQLPESFEVIVCDGGSADDSVAVARRHGACLVCAAPSRGGQLHAACAAATGEWLWMLHADAGGDFAALADQLPTEPGWGWFNVALRSDRALVGLVQRLMNRRSRLTGIATGDQGIFVHRSLLDAIGGVPQQPLMEDIELSRRLKRCARPQPQPGPIGASARRWHVNGVWRTIVTMWWLRLRYFFGADPHALAQRYYPQ